MSRINTNIGAMVARTHLARSQNRLQSTLQRLSSGLRINRGADDPAGLIASETLRSEIAGIGQAISNSERAASVIRTTEGALNEVAAMLISMQELIVEAANSGAMSDDEISANQLQVDSAVESITRISNTTTFAGLSLLNGSLSYTTSGVDETEIQDLHLYGVQFGTNSYIPVNVETTASAQKAQLEFRSSQLVSSITVQIQGTNGVTEFSFSSGTAASSISFAVNTVSDATGVQASYINAGNPLLGIIFNSVEYGEDAFVAVKALQAGATFAIVDSGGAGSTRDEGQDVVANVNGITTQGDGLKLTLQSLGLDLDLTIAENFGLGTTTFTITGGGAKFQLGPRVNTNQQVNIGIRSVAASTLGSVADGFLSEIRTGGAFSLVDGMARNASDIIQSSINQVAVLRGRLGAFEKNVLDTNINSLQITLENVTASESQLRDADFAVETSNLARHQILAQAGTSVLSIANSTPQSVLALLS